MDELHPFLKKIADLAEIHPIRRTYDIEIGVMGNTKDIDKEFPGLAFVYKGPKPRSSPALISMTVAMEETGESEKLVLLFIAPDRSSRSYSRSLEITPEEVMGHLSKILSLDLPS